MPGVGQKISGVTLSVNCLFTFVIFAQAPPQGGAFFALPVLASMQANPVCLLGCFFTQGHKPD